MDEAIIRKHAVQLAVLAEKLTHHEEAVDDLQKDLKALYDHMSDLRAAVEKSKDSNVDNAPLLLGKTASNLKDIAQWMVFVLVVLYSLGAEIPKDVLEALVKLLSKS